MIDPTTSREGWINGEHITLTEALTLAAATPRGNEAALDENAEDEALEEPKRSFKGKKSRKKYAKKRWRKSFRFVLRF